MMQCFLYLHYTTSEKDEHANVKLLTYELLKISGQLQANILHRKRITEKKD